MVKGIYIDSQFKIEGKIYKVKDMKVEHIDSPDDFIVGLFMMNVNNINDNYWESVKNFLKQPYELVANKPL